MNVLDIRKKTGLNQTTFWGKIGVTQSTGSRYENGQNLPKPIAMLIDLAYGKKPLNALAKLRGCKPAELVA